MSIAAFLVAMVGPLLARIIASLGISLITLTGATIALSTLKSTITSNIGAVPSDVMGIAGLMGIWQAIGIVLGAMTFCVTWKGTTGFMALAKK